MVQYNISSALVYDNSSAKMNKTKSKNCFNSDWAKLNQLPLTYLATTDPKIELQGRIRLYVGIDQ